MPKPLLALAGVLIVALAAHPALADESDQDLARRALERGEIRPLDQVLDAARKALPGDVVKVELDEDDGRWTYEIKILTPGGERREVEIDAKSLQVLEID